MQPELSYVNSLAESRYLKKISRFKDLAYPCDNVAPRSRRCTTRSSCAAATPAKVGRIDHGSITPLKFATLEAAQSRADHLGRHAARIVTVRPDGRHQVVDADET